jgi:hypothetical protein
VKGGITGLTWVTGVFNDRGLHRVMSEALDSKPPFKRRAGLFRVSFERCIHSEPHFWHRIR